MLNKNLVKVFAIIFSVAIVFTSISTPVKVLADSKTQQNYVEVDLRQVFGHKKIKFFCTTTIHGLFHVPSRLSK